MNVPPDAHRLLLRSIPRGDAAQSADLRRLAQSVADWDALLATAERLGATALLWQGLQDAGVPVPPAFADAGRAALVRGTLRTLLATRVLSDALAALRGRGIDALVLKGVPLAHELYRPPGLRPIGDIDLLVQRRDREAAFEALRAIGYDLPAGSLPLRFYLVHHFHVTLIRPGAEGLPLELHWDAQPRFSLSRIDVGTLWSGRRTVECDGLAVPVPGREEMFLYLCQHLLRHLIAFGPETAADPLAAMLEPARRGRLTWIADLVLLARTGPGLDWPRVDRLSLDWGLRQEIAGLRDFLAAHGDAPAGPAAARTDGGEGTLRAIRRISALAPSIARATGGVQLRPILAARLWRFAFPGPAWIRWRYAIPDDRGALPTALRGTLHAAGVFAAAARLAIAVPAGWLRGRLETPRRPQRGPEPGHDPGRPSRDCPPRIT